MKQSARKQGLDTPPPGGDSKPRRAHRRTGHPRGGKRTGAGRKGAATLIWAMAAKAAGISPRTGDRIRRVQRYSPLLYQEIATGKCRPGLAERLVTMVLRGEVPAALRLRPIVKEIQAHVAKQARQQKRHKPSRKE